MTKFLRRRDKSVFFLRTDPIILMRLSCLYCMIFLSTATVLAANPSRGQGLDQEIFIGMNHENLEALIKKIEAASDFTSAYYSSAFEPYNDITFEPAKRTIREALELGFRGTGLEYTVKGRVIVVGNRSDGVLAASGPVDIGNAETVSVRVTGKVKDANGVPLPGVNVLVKGTTIGTATDAEGAFALEMPEEAKVLVFSFVGLKTVEMDAVGRATFDVTMESDVATLQTVEISGGYYKTTNKSKTGAIIRVSAEEIARQPVTNPLMALQGKVPGLQIVPNSGAPGGALKIVIRGRNSLRNNAQSETANGPLIIIDGVPIDMTPLNTGASSLSNTIPAGYDPLSTLNPDNIEAVEVLKDADATAIYGSRGANGVILITTKKNKEGDKTVSNMMFYSGFGRAVSRMNLLNTEEYLIMRREAYKNDGVEPGDYDFDVNGVWDSKRYTDWQEELFGGTARIHDVQIGVSGGNNNATSLKVDVAYHKENVIYSGDFGYQRLSGNLAVRHVSTDRKFLATINANYGFNRNRTFESGGLVAQALTLPPNAPPLYDANGELNWEIIDFGFYKASLFDNPFAKLKNTNESKTGNLIVNGDFNYTILHGLSVKANVGISDLNGDELLKFPIAANSPANIYPSTTARAVFGRNSRRTWIVEPQIVFVNKLGGHSINAVAGASLQESTTGYQSVEGSGYVSDVLLDNLRAATTTIVTSDVNNRYKYLAFFVRLGYDWKGKYLISLTGRRDGSSRFSPERQFGNFGAIGVAWIFSDETWVKDYLRFFSFGKIRASYGVTGNDQIGDYKFFNTYRISDYRYNQTIALSPTALYNPRYSWETTRKSEVAVEFGFFDDRILVELGYYANRSSNQLINYQLPLITGFDQVLSNSNAIVQNSGLESSLHISPIRMANFRWDIAFNVSLNRNKLIDFPGLEDSPYASMYRVGESLSVRRFFSFKGVNSDNGKYEISDVNGDGFYDDKDLHFSGSLDPQYYGGLSNTVQFRRFELSLFFQFAKQNRIRYDTGVPGTARNMPSYVLDRWRKEGDHSSVARFTRNYSEQLFRQLYLNGSDYSIEDGSFIRLRTLSLSYSTSFSKHRPGQQLRFFIQGQNLWTTSSCDCLDPETGVSLPPLKMITLGIQAKI